MQTSVSSGGPALKVAQIVVLPGRDHREVFFHPEAFAQAFRFITGALPARTSIAPEPTVVLDGRITGFRGTSQTNLPLAGASLEIFETAAQTGERIGKAVHAKTVDANGHWGPFN